MLHYSCDHTTNCKIAPPHFDSATYTVTVSTTKTQYIIPNPNLYDENTKYYWTVLEIPGTTSTKYYTGSRVLTYIFDKIGIYKFQLVSEKLGCKSDSILISVNSVTAGGNPPPSDPCTITTGKFKLQSTTFTATNVPSFTSTTNYGYTGLYDNSSNNVYFYLPKTFKNSPLLADYTINSTKTYSQLSGSDCAIEIQGTRYAAINPSTAVVHIKSGTTKTIELSVCNFQYKYNGNIYTLEAKFEFNP